MTRPTNCVFNEKFLMLRSVTSTGTHKMAVWRYMYIVHSVHSFMGVLPGRNHDVGLDQLFIYRRSEPLFSLDMTIIISSKF